uniref:Dual oxidase 2 n=1 Tax=Oryzias latipes TaxID=8090 RepID=A0A3P9IVH7_ORYLA
MTFYNDIYPFYPLQRISFIFSGRLLTIILVFLVLASTLLLILPGIRGKSVCLNFSGLLNFTDNWAEARMTTNATYKSFSSAVINAEVGLHVGLYGINVTLKDVFHVLGNPVEEYEEALEKGLPNPILYIVEKFTLNSPCGLIFQYRYSGRFASATLWTAFCSWMLSNILFSMPVILYAGYMMIVTAGFIFFSMASFSTIMNVPQCVFSIGTDSVSTEYSHSFWLALATGVLCTIIGTVVVMLNFLMPERIKTVFSVCVDGCEDEDVFYREGYLNSVFLDGAHSPLPLTVKEVSLLH